MLSVRSSLSFSSDLICSPCAWYRLSKNYLRSFDRLYLRRICSEIVRPCSREEGEIDFSGWLSFSLACSSGSRNFSHRVMFSYSMSSCFFIKSSSAASCYLPFSATSPLLLSMMSNFSCSPFSMLPVTLSNLSWINFFSRFKTISSYWREVIFAWSRWALFFSWALILAETCLLYELGRFCWPNCCTLTWWFLSEFNPFTAGCVFRCCGVLGSLLPSRFPKKNGFA